MLTSRDEINYNRADIIHYNRNIDDFNGNAVIIGGGWALSHLKHKDKIRNQNNFYTIDINPEAKPDAVMDITREYSESFAGSRKFNFVYFECFPWLGDEKQLLAFRAARQLLNENGIVIYHGGSMKSECSIPELLELSGFKYAHKKELISIKSERDNGNISIASYQDLSIIQQSISNLDKATIHYINKYNFFSPEPYNSTLDNNSEAARKLLESHNLFFISEQAIADKINDKMKRTAPDNLDKCSCSII